METGTHQRPRKVSYASLSLALVMVDAVSQSHLTRSCLHNILVRTPRRLFLMSTLMEIPTTRRRIPMRYPTVVHDPYAVPYGQSPSKSPSRNRYETHAMPSPLHPPHVVSSHRYYCHLFVPDHSSSMLPPSLAILLLLTSTSLPHLR